MSNIIEFSTSPVYLEICEKENMPSPIKNNIPAWYKKLQHELGNLTVKGCMPFLDTLTSGYLLKVPQDISLNHNTINDEGKKDSFFLNSLHGMNNFLEQNLINLNSKDAQVHPIEQAKGCPYVEQNKNLPFFKILNPWKIITPKGYSCLFLPPMNNQDDRFFIIPGIVETDSFHQEINFPIVINGDKYPTLKTIIKKGTPYVQVIPFKRESWKIKISSFDINKQIKETFIYNSTLIRKYQNLFWNKKTWS